MVEDYVVKEPLTDAMIDAGAEVVRKLDETGLPVTAAFWCFMPELSAWRLMIASPDVGTKGPRVVYEHIQRALKELGPLGAQAPLAQISVLEPRAQVVRALVTATPTGPGVSRIRFARSAVNGHYIDDVLVYRAA
jgi:hypothetical protein